MTLLPPFFNRMSSKQKSPKTPKNTNRHRIKDTQMRMHARAHLLTMKNQKIMKHQKRLIKERSTIDKELEETSLILSRLKSKQNNVMADLQTSVSYTTDSLLLESEEKYGKFLESLLSNLKVSAKEPFKDNGETTEELEEILKELEAEDERLQNDEISLHKNKHIERLNVLVDDVTLETEKHEKEAREAEVELQKSLMEKREEDIISRQLDIWLSRANERKDNAITELTMIDIKKKHAIVKRAQARAKREDVENQTEEISQKEKDLRNNEDNFLEESNYTALEEEEWIEQEMIYTAPKVDRNQIMLERQKDFEHIESFIDEYSQVLNSEEKKEKEKQLKNENYKLYKMEENIKWCDHWENKNKEADEEIKLLERYNKKNELEEKIVNLEKEIENITSKGAEVRAEIDNEEGIITISEEKINPTDPIVIPDYKTEIVNIQNEYDSLSLRKAAAEREIIRIKALKEVTEKAEDFINGIEQ